MMTTMEKTAKQWLSDEVQQRARRITPNHDAPKLLLSPVSWVLPKLLRIVYQNADQPVEVLAPLIRAMLQEQVFVTTGGDPCDCEQLDASINESVAVVVRVLERVRQHSHDLSKTG